MARASPAGLAMYASRGKWQLAGHLALLDDLLLEVAAGGTRRVLVSMPPRHGKSMLLSQYLPAWYIGTFPDRRVILASYEAHFAATWGRKARDVLEEHGSLFGGVRVRQDSSAADRWDIEGRLGGMMTAGVGGPLTGKGCDLLLVDDPLKNSRDSNSRTIRDSIGEWWESTAYTRLEPQGAAIITMTRWHEDDLAGRLQKAMEAGGEEWKIVKLPAEAEDGDPMGRMQGEPLWPERFSSDDMLRIKRAIGGYYWTALYQQRPAPEEGSMFRREWFRYFRREDGYYLLFHEGKAKRVEASHCWTFQTCDPAATEKETSDYFVLSTWAVTPDRDLLLLDVVRTRAETTKHLALLVAGRERWRPAFQGVEAQSFGLNILQSGRMAGLPLKPLKADHDKVSRARIVAARYEIGAVYHLSGAEWLGEFEGELLAFPRGGHDDQVDTASYAGIEIAGSPEPRVIRL